MCRAILEGNLEVWWCLQPVCTTEIGRLALKYKELSSKGVKIATLSADPVRHRHPCRTCSLFHPPSCATVNGIQVLRHGHQM